MSVRIQVRRGSSSEWNDSDPILNEGEVGYNSTLAQIKIGDGESIWSDLDYFVSDSSLGTSLGSYIETSEKSSASGVAELDATKNILAPAGIVFEGTPDDYETTLTLVDPTADRTITFPDATGTVALTSDIAELSQDAINTALTAGTGITKTYDDGANTLTLAIDTTTIQSRVTDVSDTEIGYLDGVTSAIQTQIDAKLASATASSTYQPLVANVTDTEIGYLDGVTSAIQAQIDDKAPIDSPTFTGTVAGISSTMVGLGSVDNTSDANKPVSTATQSALDLKANLADPTFTGTVNAAALTLSGNLTVNGTTTTINSTTLSVDDKNIVLGDVDTPTDTTADGGGITLLGATNKTFNWVDATDSWTSSEHMDLVSGKSYKINNTAISAALPTLTWGEVKDGKSGLVIS